MRIWLTVLLIFAGAMDCRAQSTSPAPAAAQADSDRQAALEAQLRILQQEVAELRAELRRTSAPDQARPAQPESGSPDTPSQPSPPATPTASPVVTQASPDSGDRPARDTIGDELTGVARADTGAPPNDPELRGYIAIPGTETRIKLGGFAKVNAIYDTGPAGNRDKFVPATIPIGVGGERNATINASATRLSLDVRRPSSLGPLRFYLENDFYGSGTMGFRLRQAHGQVGNTYGGYGYSAFMDSDALPETLDDEGPPGATFLRVAAVRQIFKLGQGWTATLSVENPSTRNPPDERGRRAADARHRRRGKARTKVGPYPAGRDRARARIPAPGHRAGQLRLWRHAFRTAHGEQRFCDGRRHLRQGHLPLFE